MFRFSHQITIAHMKTVVKCRWFLRFLKTNNAIAITFFLKRNTRNVELFDREDKYKIWRWIKKSMVKWRGLWGTYWKENGIESEEPTLNDQATRLLYLMTRERGIQLSVGKADRCLLMLIQVLPFPCTACKWHPKGEHRWEISIFPKTIYFET